MGLVRTYSPDQVKVAFGPAIVSGFADGTFIKIEQMTDGVQSESGADGEVARAMSTDRRHRVTVTLQQTSPVNEAFSAIYLQDRITYTGTVPMVISDLSGKTLFEAGSAWIIKMPDAEFSKGFSNREWVIETASANFVIGGGILASSDNT